MSASQNKEKAQPDWMPKSSKNTILSDFIGLIAKKDANIEENSDYDAFWRWSTDRITEFWSYFWDYAEIIGEKGDIALQNPEKMTGSQFFPNGKVNYAQNLLRHRGENAAIIFRNELGAEKTYNFDDVYDQVSLWQQVLLENGVKKGDRVAAMMPNMPETIFATIAAASIGAIWSSASPDFGVQGLLDRFGQIKPKIFIAVDGYYYGGKKIDCLEKVKDVQSQLETLNKTIIVPFLNDCPDISSLSDANTTTDVFTDLTPKDMFFEEIEFNHPLFIMFSSGTTGVPKCIVHGHGGTLIQHLKEHQLQCDIRAGDPIFYFTTCGWMMWNWLITGLAGGATLLLYDGNPFYPTPMALWEFTSKHKATLFGTSAKYIDALKAHNIKPKEGADLSHLKIITSTGSPLVHESFDYIYKGIKEDVHISSISGGTDIVSCFVLGNPISPVWRGEIQGAGLGLAVDVFNEEGQPIPKGAGSGELVCTKPFPSMPVSFWNDPDGTKFKKAYFEKFDNIWCHGDWIERTENNGLIIHGRSDATLNPGGVRIGTAEIYRQVEQVPEVLESIAVGQDWEGDVRVILFVILKEDIQLTDDIIKEIKTKIRAGASPRHVPAKIVQVTDIPKTKSGKMTELAVKDVIHDRPIKNKEALTNPEALNLYKDLEILKTA